jgi:two-component system chemotaxis response regulator CheY
MKNCLIVDDSRVIRKVARQILEATGFGCEEAENGQIALEHCQKAVPDFILLDWNMPVMNGMEFMQALQKLAPPKKPIIIFCSVENSLPKIQVALDAGADEYIMKPFDGDIIRDKLDQLGLLS